MSNVLDVLKRKTLIMDGAMGTLLLNEGVRPGECFEYLSVDQPELIEQIHREYIRSGADIIETNTFGANRYKLGEYGHAEEVRKVILSAAQIIKIVRETEGSDALIAGSMGPIGKMIEPLGDLSFDGAVEMYKEMALSFAEAGVDIVCIETISDIQEARAAIIAVKENTNLPVIVSMTYEDRDRTITGTPPEVASVVFESLGVDVIGANCSGGPKELLTSIERYVNSTNKPIFAMPNAGLPEVDEAGGAVYNMTPEQFAGFGKKFAAMGANIIGGCCGTTPGHILALALAIGKRKPTPRKKVFPVRFASRTRVVNVDPKKLLIIGERINPTGNKDLRGEIEHGKTTLIREFARFQSAAGADLLDVNVSVAGIDGISFIKKALHAVSASSDLPVSIDSPSHKVIEEALKHFPGKPLLNSTTGKQKDLKSVLPMAKKYGAAVIGLTLDDKGVPDEAGAKFKIAKKILSAAGEIGFPKEEIFIDTLVMTMGVDKSAPIETLEALKSVKNRLKAKTSLGISNVSHGLPDRKAINQTYLYMARKAGVDAVIMDPLEPVAMKIARGLKAPKMKNISKIEVKRQAKAVKEKAARKKVEVKKANVLGKIKNSVIDGDVEESESLVKKAIGFKYNPQDVMDKALVAGLEVVGKKFSAGEYFLPEVVSSAAAMKAGFDIAEKYLKKKKSKKLGTVVIATVHGDIHDIGKNIVILLLANHGFKVIDMGKDVPAEAIVEAAIREKADVIALSALLTTTMPEMKAVKEALQRVRLNIPVMVGGAAVTKNYADKIGTNYSKDAVSAVSLAKAIIKKVKKK
ncbi:homocysteine S-methyltransferase family protein [Candidatus Margulisiibacteriota bacterium]